jgi:putative transposase
MMDRIALVKSATGFCLYAWVIMPEHIHMVIKTGSTDVTGKKILHRLKWPFARTVIGRWRKLGAKILPRITDATGDLHFWQTGGGYDRNLVREEEWFEKINYVHNNPVRRGLVAQPTDWRWSSARWYDGDRTGPPIDPLW